MLFTLRQFIQFTEHAPKEGRSLFSTSTKTSRRHVTRSRGLQRPMTAVDITALQCGNINQKEVLEILHRTEM